MTGNSVAWPTSSRTVPLWSLFERVKDVGHPEEPMLSVYRDHGVVLKDARSDNFNKTAEDRNIYQLVDVGWLAVNRMKAWQGSLGISSLRGIVSGHYICFRPRHRESARFLDYLLRSPVYAVELRRLSRGVRPAQVEIDNDGLRALPVRLPPTDEQHRIADYLDAESARIDALVAKKQSMASLMLERVDRLRGDAFGAPDSLRLKHLLREPMAYGVLVPRFVEPGDGVRMMRINNLKSDGTVELDDVAWIEHALSNEFRRTVVRTGDLVLSVVGSMGRSAVVTSECDGANLNRAIARVQPRSDLPVRLLWHWTQTAAFLDHARRATGASSAQPTLNLGDLAEFPVGIDRDSSRWQSDLGELERRLRPIDECVDKLTLQIALLQERKQALITAAVTGELEIPAA